MVWMRFLADTILVTLCAVFFLSTHNVYERFMGFVRYFEVKEILMDASNGFCVMPILSNSLSCPVLEHPVHLCDVPYLLFSADSL